MKYFRRRARNSRWRRPEPQLVKVLHCSHCHQVVFFENTQCVNCGYKLAYVPDLADMAAVEADSGDLWRMVDGSREPRRIRRCQNYLQEYICNWAVAGDD